MDTREVIQLLVSNRQRFGDIREFSNRPGIYAVFCALVEIPNLPCQLHDTDILYIGKTESSQKSRDAHTHFADGKTGTSTLRRSFGALLRDSLALRPIPRNATNYAKNRRSQFKFDEESEQMLTRWMREHLSLSFYEFEGNMDALGELETRLIQTVVPPLNLVKNHDGPHVRMLRQLRSETAATACANSGDSSALRPPHSSRSVAERTAGRNGSGKYQDLWSDLVGQLLPSLQRGSTEISRQLSHQDFESVGRRKLYAFNLELRDGTVTNNVDGSAVARDLAQVLQQSGRAMSVLQHGHWKFRLDSNLQLVITKKN